MYISPYYAPLENRKLARKAGSVRASNPDVTAPIQASLPEDTSSFLSNVEPGNLASGISGAAGLITNTINMSNESLGLDKSAPAMQYSPTGEPVYNTGAYYNEISRTKPQGTTAGEAIGGLTQGAMAGAAVGGPVGAAIGGAVGLVGSFIGGHRRKEKQKEERRRAMRSAKAAQLSYNDASVAFDQSQASMQDYYRRLDDSSRLHNLYY